MIACIIPPMLHAVPCRYHTVRYVANPSQESVRGHHGLPSCMGCLSSYITETLAGSLQQCLFQSKYTHVHRLTCLSGLDSRLDAWLIAGSWRVTDGSTAIGWRLQGERGDGHHSQCERGIAERMLHSAETDMVPAALVCLPIPSVCPPLFAPLICRR